MLYSSRVELDRFLFFVGAVFFFIFGSDGKSYPGGGLCHTAKVYVGFCIVFFGGHFSL